MTAAGAGRRMAARNGLLVWAASAAALWSAADRPVARTAEAPLPRWAVVRGEPGFSRRLGEALARLRTAPAGAALLGELDAVGKPVVFRPWTLPSGSSAGSAGGAVVWWNPDFGGPETPAHVALHHELVHAFQTLRGASEGGGRMEEEAVGVGAFARAPYTENALRRDLGLPHRPSHDVLPGFTEGEMARLFRAAYSDKDYALRRMAPPAPAGRRFRRIEVETPSWVN